jgi:transcriptional regulator with XRE-family HTH domain
MSNTDHERDEQGSDPDSTPIQRAIRARRQRQVPSDPALGPDDQQLVEDILPWLDALHEAAQQTVLEPQPDAEPPAGAQVPVRADDPVALMLGLVPDPAVVVNGRKLAAARKRAHLDLGQLVDRLRVRGWDVTTQQGLQWELGHLQLPPALITALAEELSVEDDELLGALPTRRENADLFDNHRIQAFITDWAAEVGIEPGLLRERTSTTLAGAAHRNRTGGSIEALLDVLRTLRSIPDYLDNL